MGQERRQHSRYRLEGQAVFRTAKALEAVARPLNVGLGGILLRSEVIPPEGVELWLHVSFEGRPEVFLTRGRIVRSESEGLAVIFLDAPAGLETLLRSATAPANPAAAACS